MKHSLSDLNAYLFDSLDRLTNDSLTGDELAQEIQRSKAVTATAGAIVENAKIILDASKFAKEYDIKVSDVLPAALPDGAE